MRQRERRSYHVRCMFLNPHELVTTMVLDEDLQPLRPTTEILYQETKRISVVVLPLSPDMPTGRPEPRVSFNASTRSASSSLNLWPLEGVLSSHSH